jgi:RNase H-fold protein (predicted Holliday junction resolvase)
MRWWSACPVHPDGAPHDNTRRAQRFARQLHGRFGLPVHEVDERYSTTEAAGRRRAPHGEPHDD